MTTKNKVKVPVSVSSKTFRQTYPLFARGVEHGTHQQTALFIHTAAADHDT